MVCVFRKHVLGEAYTGTARERGGEMPERRRGRRKEAGAGPESGRRQGGNDPALGGILGESGYLQDLVGGFRSVPNWRSQNARPSLRSQDACTNLRHQSAHPNLIQYACTNLRFHDTRPIFLKMLFVFRFLFFLSWEAHGNLDRGTLRVRCTS